MASVTKLQLKSGIWRLKLSSAGQPDSYRMLPKGASEGEAEAARLAWKDGIEGDGGAAFAPTMTLGAFLELAAGMQTHLRQRTAERYAELRALHLGPLADKRLTRITMADAHALQRRLLDKGLSPTTVRAAFQQAHSGLIEAVRLGVLPADPWRHARPVRAPEADISVPSEAACSRAVASVPGRLGLLLRLAYGSGARRGEMLGLRWSDFDPAAGWIHIQRTLELRDDGSIAVMPPKTRNSRRRIGLAPALVAELKTARVAAGAAAIAGGEGVTERPVLPAHDGRSWWDPREATKAASAALSRAGLAASLHTLRHAHASALLSAGVGLPEVSRRLGHASGAFTVQRYGHAMPADDGKAVAAIGSIMEQAA